MAKSRKKKGTSEEHPHSKDAGSKRLPKAMWKGSISFGLVNIPIRMFSAYKPKEIHFHMLHAKDKSRIQEKIECSAEDKEIGRDDIVKGYEVSPGHHVIVTDEELEALAPKGGRTIDLIKFVDMAEIDPIYYARPYYLVPEEGAAKAYSLFVQALSTSKKVGIAKFVLRSKEYLAALRILDGAVCLETMHFHDEIVHAKDIQHAIQTGKVSEREMKAAEQLIESLTEAFEPEQLHDDYRERVQQLIRQKVEGHEVTVAPAEEKTPEVVDLMSALEASLAQAGKKKGRKAA